MLVSSELLVFVTSPSFDALPPVSVRAKINVLPSFGCCIIEFHGHLCLCSLSLLTLGTRAQGLRYLVCVCVCLSVSLSGTTSPATMRSGQPKVSTASAQSGLNIMAFSLKMLCSKVMV